MKMVSVFESMSGARRLFVRFARNTRGLAAVEFAFIVPLMLTLIFGTIEVSNLVAIDRKVTLVSRTISDLVSQGTKVSTTDIANFFKISSAILTPYPVTPATLTAISITAINIDATKKTSVAWSYSGVVNGSTATVTKQDASKIVAGVPSGLLVPNTQLIWSQTTYNYKPILGYVIGRSKDGIDLKDESYTRPRQSAEVTGPTS